MRSPPTIGKGDRILYTAMPSDCFDYLYLHGFASGPKSAKAQYLRDRFSECAITLNIPDLNQGDFLNLTLTRQIRQVEAEFFAPPRRAIAIGSSFGGLTATWLAQRQASIEKLVLLAPAFDFLSHLLPHLGRTQLQQWQNDGTLSVYHYGYGQETPLKYNFIKDLTHYDDGKLGRFIPTLILPEPKMKSSPSRVAGISPAIAPGWNWWNSKTTTVWATFCRTSGNRSKGFWNCSDRQNSSETISQKSSQSI